MKKNLIILIIIIILGCFSGKLVYEKINDVYALNIKNDNIVYFLQVGVYSNEKTLLSDTNEINNKLVIKKNNNYYVYVGISKKKDNLEKISAIYNKLGYNLYLSEMEIKNEEFLSNLEQFDLLLSKASSEDEINSINSVVLSSYEEMVLKK